MKFGNNTAARFFDSKISATKYIIGFDEWKFSPVKKFALGYGPLRFSNVRQGVKKFILTQFYFHYFQNEMKRRFIFSPFQMFFARLLLPCNVHALGCWLISCPSSSRESELLTGLHCPTSLCKLSEWLHVMSVFVCVEQRCSCMLVHVCFCATVVLFFVYVREIKEGREGGCCC